LTTAAEGDFVFNLINSAEYWYRGEFGPLIGGFQPSGSEPLGGWTWITGESWIYENWAGGQPDNGAGMEEALHFWSGNHWNDIPKDLRSYISYVVERDEPPCTPHKAKATAELVNGFVIAATVTDSGCGYTNPPAVLVKGGGGSGALAQAVISTGVVVAIQILDAGFGYTSPPAILIASPPFVPKLGINVRRIEVSQEVVLGWKYVLETSTNNLDWTATGPAFVADEESLSTEFDVDSAGRFFRLVP
jgi:hypothetical protein